MCPPNRRVRTRTHGGVAGKDREILPMLISPLFPAYGSTSLLLYSLCPKGKPRRKANST